MKVKWKEYFVSGPFKAGKLRQKTRHGKIIYQNNGHCLVKPDDSDKLVPIALKFLKKCEAS